MPSLDIGRVVRGASMNLVREGAQCAYKERRDKFLASNGLGRQDLGKLPNMPLAEELRKGNVEPVLSMIAKDGQVADLVGVLMLLELRSETGDSLAEIINASASLRKAIERGYTINASKTLEALGIAFWRDFEPGEMAERDPWKDVREVAAMHGGRLSTSYADFAALNRSMPPRDLPGRLKPELIPDMPMPAQRPREKTMGDITRELVQENILVAFKAAAVGKLDMSVAMDDLSTISRSYDGHKGRLALEILRILEPPKAA